MFGKKLNKRECGEIVYDFNVKQIPNRQRVCCIMNFSIFLGKKSSQMKCTNRAKYMSITWENFSAKLFQCLKGKHVLSGVI